MARLISRTISQWGPEKIASQRAVAELAGLDLQKSHNVNRFGLLLSLMELPHPAQVLTADSFKSLKPEQQEAMILEAAEKAASTANVKAGALLRRFNYNEIQGGELKGAEEEAETYLLEYTPYLSPENQKVLARILPKLKQRREKLQEAARKKTEESLENTRRHLEQGKNVEFNGEKFPVARFDDTPPDGEIGSPSGYEGWLPNPALGLQAHEPGPNEKRVLENISRSIDPQKRFDLDRASIDRSPLLAVKERFSEALGEAGAQGNALLFWDLASQAFAALGQEIRRDGLDFISKHPLGPWARAKLAAYALQNGELASWLYELQGDYGIPQEKRSWFSILHRHVRSQSRVNRMINKVQGGLSSREERLRLKAARAGREMERLLESYDGRIAPHLWEVVGYYVARVEEAESNPDPNHRAAVNDELLKDRWPWGVPSWKRTGEICRLAVNRNIEALKREGPRWTLVMALSLLVVVITVIAGVLLHPALVAPLVALGFGLLNLSLAMATLASLRMKSLQNLAIKFPSLFTP